MEQERRQVNFRADEAILEKIGNIQARRRPVPSMSEVIRLAIEELDKSDRLKGSARSEPR